MKNCYLLCFKKTFLIVLFFCISNLVFSQQVYEWYQDGKIIFQLKPSAIIDIPSDNNGNADINKIDFLKKLEDKYGIVKITQKHPDNINVALKLTYEIEFTNQFEVDVFTKELSQLDYILYAEKKELHKLFYTPNDPLYTSTNMWHLFKINAAQAWDISLGSSSVIVAITDNAIQVTHNDLVNNVVAGRDVADGDNNTNPPNNNTSWTHGTHVAGTSGSSTNNSTGVASIGFNIKIMPVKIAQDATGTLTSGYEGITWAAQNGAHVINMSWGGGASSNYGLTVVNNAYNLGIVLVAGAGNDNVQTMFYPAAYPNVISVAATASNDTKSSFSQFGSWIDISAPGTNIRSTTLGNTYGNLSGTSMASPLVAGLCGLMLSVNPAMTPAQVKSCLQSSAVNIDAQNSAYVGLLGAGRINAYEAMICANASTVALDAAVVKISSPAGSSCNGDFTPMITLRNLGSNTLTSVIINFQLDALSSDTYNWVGSLASGQSTNVTLPIQSTSSGMHILYVNSSSPNGSTDENTSNDSLFVPFSVSLINTFTYLDDFESGGDFWSHSATGVQNTNLNASPGDKWQLGVPAGTVLNSAYSGTKVYATNLSGVHDYSTYNYLQSPCFDLSSLIEPRVEFYMAFVIEQDWDALYFEYSINNGDTWTKLGTSSSPNWYNSSLVGNGSTTGLLCNGSQWTGTSSTWKLYGHDLPFLVGESSVKFRFNMASDEYEESEGVVIDNFVVYDKTTTGIKTQTESAVSIFPNPSTGNVFVTLNGNESKQVEAKVYNLMGELMVQMNENNFQNREIKIDLSNYANGIYLVEVRTDEQLMVKKIMLNK
ncbi:MAG: S8 family peptidase [Bacteroidetes bacterium]|nr:S8 family peptidase [Bacteroidota bacterium]HET6244802.1 S8 family serine peptidase [Bacteroidia bacterium]